MTPPSLQERFAPLSACFGCGPANPTGLQLRSFVRDDGTVTARWQPAAHHQAFPGILNGGIIGTLLDCHGNWTAAWHLMNRAQLDHPLCTVTADYAVKLLRPTPLDASVELIARVTSSTDDRATVEAELFSSSQLRATCRGTFVAVRPGHPAFHQWHTG